MSLSEKAIAHRKEQAQEYYLRVKDKRKLQARAWYLRNKEKRLSASRKWAKENRERINEHRRNHPEIYRAAARKWRLNNPELHRNVQRAAGIKKRFGITAEEYDRKIEEQNGRCEICRCLPSGNKSKSKLHLDHDHRTKKLRGFICGHCNTALGMAKDSMEVLKAMICYLKKYA